MDPGTRRSCPPKSRQKKKSRFRMIPGPGPMYGKMRVPIRSLKAGDKIRLRSRPTWSVEWSVSGSHPKPRRAGYNAAYRMKLEQEFNLDTRLHRLPRWMKETVSLMLKEIENLRAELEVVYPPADYTEKKC